MKQNFSQKQKQKQKQNDEIFRAKQVRLIQQQIDQKVEKARIEKKRLKTFACKRCFVKFSSNIKFHEHIRDHHAKKSKFVVSNFTSFTFSESIIFLFDSSKFASKILFISSTSSQSIFFSIDNLKFALQSKILFISFFSSFQSIIFSLNFILLISIFSSFFTSKRVISSKFSLFSNSASKFVSNRLKIVSIVFSITFFYIFRKSVSMRSTFLFKSIFKTSSQKFYLTIDDLFRMFVEKSKSINLQQHQNHQFFSRIFDISKRNFMQTRIIVYFLSISKSTKFEIFTSMYDLIKQSIRTSFQRSFLFRFFSYFFSIRFLFSTSFFFLFVDAVKNFSSFVYFVIELIRLLRKLKYS